jgi:hypothetical protein
MHEIQSTININAPVAHVWQVLTNFKSYPDWNPFIVSITGKINIGAQLRVKMQLPGRKATTFKPQIINLVPNGEFRWLGKLGIPGLFDGEHYFMVSSNDENGTTLIHGERFKGILVPLFKRILSDTEKAFVEMNRALKVECEREHPNH